MNIACLMLVSFLCGHLTMDARDRSASQTSSSNSALSRTPASFGAPELEFIPNRGQIRTNSGASTQHVLYVVRSGSTTCYLTSNTLQFVQSTPTAQHRTDVLFVGANPTPRILEHDTSAGVLNFYLDGVRVEGVRAVRRLTYVDLYPNIDLVLYSHGATMKYDFIVHPGGNPNNIVMRYAGMDALQILKDGRCRASTPIGTIDELRPYTYQLHTPTRHNAPNTSAEGEVRSEFVRKGNEVSFRIGVYDRTRDLVIDPQRVWATYFGGNQDQGACVRTDADGNAVMVGWALGSSYVSTTGAHQTNGAGGVDGFVVKFSNAGVRLWGTYYGGPGEDTLCGLAIDASNTIYVGGRTTSASGLTTTGAHQVVRAGPSDMFLASFSANGQLNWGTYFGGNKSEVAALAHCVGMTPDGNVAIVGHTNSDADFATAGAHKTVLDNVSNIDGALGVFSSAGVLQWSTYIGGTALENVYGIAADTLNDRIVLSGFTYSADGISTTGTHQVNRNGPFDGFVMSFTNAGVRQWGTYFGGNGGDVLVGVVCDSAGFIYASGITGSNTGIATPGAHSGARRGTEDAILLKLNSGGARQWSTYFGGFGHEDGFGIALGDSTVYISGNTFSNSDIATTGALYTTLSGTADAFVAAFSPDGVQRWGTYYGGDNVEDGLSVCTYDDRSVYLCSGTRSNNNIATPGAHQTALITTNNAYLARFCDAVTPLLTAVPDTSLCVGETMEITASPSAVGMRWYDGNTLLTEFNDSSKYRAPDNLSIGTHQIWSEIVGANCINRSDTVMLVVHARPTSSMTPDTTVCAGSTIRLNATGVGGKPPYLYLWFPSTGLDNPLIARPTVTITDSVAYKCLVSDANGCAVLDTVHISVRSRPALTLQRTVFLCAGDSVRIGDTATAGRPPYTYTWQPSAGLSSANAARPFAAPSSSTKYFVTVTDANGCTTTDSVFVLLRAKPVPLINAADTVLSCDTNGIVLRATRGYVSYSWSNGGTADSIVVRNTGSYFVTVVDSQGCKAASRSVRVIIAPITDALITGPDAACVNSSVVYNASGEAGNGYSWSISGGGAITSTTPPQRAVVHWTGVGTWSLSVTAQNIEGCSATATLNVVVSDTLSPTVTPAGPITLCKDQSVVLRAPKGFVTYEWNNGASSDTIVVTTSGIYSVSVLGEGGCDGKSEDVVVTVLTTPAPAPVIAASATVLCDGDSATLSLAPTGFASYQWSTGATSPSIVVRSSGTYYAVVIDANGCTGISDTVEIQSAANAAAVITPQGPTEFCAGGKVALSAPLGPFTYEWSTGETTRDIEVQTSGMVWLRIRTSEGCVDSTSVTITVYDASDIVVSGPDAVCYASQATYTITQSPSSIVWSVTPPGLGTITSGQGSASVSIDWGSTTGTATVTATITFAAGCTANGRIDVAIDSVLHPTITSSGPTTFCDGDSVVLRVASGYNTYAWSNANGTIQGATSRSLVVRTAGAYSCKVTSATACVGTTDVVGVTVHPLPNQPIITLLVTDLISTPAAAYQWSRDGVELVGENGQSVPIGANGLYTVTITDINGCRSTSDPYAVGGSAEAHFAVGGTALTNPNAIVDVPIVLLNSTDLDVANAVLYEGKLRYNGTMLLPRSARDGSITLPDQAIAGTEFRSVAFSGNRGTATTGRLMSIEFATLLGSDTCTSLELFDVRFTDASVNVTTVNGSFCESGICIIDGQVRLINGDVRLALQPIHPNPTSGEVQITYELFEHGHTTILLTDLLGREVRLFVDEAQQQGSYTKNLNLVNLATGSYRVVLRTPSAQRQQLLVVTSSR